MIEALGSGETLEAGGESPSGGVGEALGSGEVKVKDLKQVYIYTNKLSEENINVSE